MLQEASLVIFVANTFDNYNIIIQHSEPCEPEGAVRLVDGQSSLEGRLEICNNTVWGTVCNENWDESDARVVCRQLGVDNLDGNACVHII